MGFAGRFSGNKLLLQNAMKTLKVPFIPGLESLGFKELDEKMEAGAAKSYIDTVCWPEEFPYAPDAAFSVARSESHIVIMYRVRGFDLRAAALEDNGPVWEDSCCEFFVGHPSDGTYYNFEMNCIGTVLAAKRKSRNDSTPFTKEDLSAIQRFSTLEKRAIEECGGIFSWMTAICIPFASIGLSPDSLPDKLRANFYKCGDKTAHPHFLSWNPVRTETPDFHRPEFFGELLLK